MHEVEKTGAFFAGVVLAAAFGAAAVAQDSPQRMEMKRAGLSGAPGMEVVSCTGDYGLGEEIRRHIHHGVESA